MSEQQNHHDKPEVDEVTGVDTTGHEWDGLKELNNPLPRWWLIIFYATVIWSVVYWVFMPSWPGISGHLRGLRDHSERANVAADIAELRSARAEAGEKLLSARSLEEIENDPALLQFAMAAGASAFGDNCATCHGTGGRGFKGYPNLNDDVWLWGGSLEEIKQTITYGIRSAHGQTRFSMMPAFGEQNILNRDQINDMVLYLGHLNGQEVAPEIVERSEPLYMAQCATCHGADAQGDRSQGAPSLVDREWLYGNEPAEIRHSIYYARNGVMPNWNERLDETTITALAIYVHTLGGGE